MDPASAVCDKCGKPMAEREGRYGKFLACTGYPDCRNTVNLPGQEHPLDRQPAQTVNEACDKCGKPMALKQGRYGPFIACTGYPDCRNIKNIQEKTGAKCPECGKGDIVSKRSRKGRTFYSCNQYPTCKFALWGKPTGEKCPKCQSLMVAGSGDSVRCSNKDCK